MYWSAKGAIARIGLGEPVFLHHSSLFCYPVGFSGLGMKSLPAFPCPLLLTVAAALPSFCIVVIDPTLVLFDITV